MGITSVFPIIVTSDYPRPARPSVAVIATVK